MCACTTKHTYASPIGTPLFPPRSGAVGTEHREREDIAQRPAATFQTPDGIYSSDNILNIPK